MRALRDHVIGVLWQGVRSAIAIRGAPESGELALADTPVRELSMLVVRRHLCRSIV